LPYRFVALVASCFAVIGLSGSGSPVEVEHPRPGDKGRIGRGEVGARRHWHRDGDDPAGGG